MKSEKEKLLEFVFGPTNKPYHEKSLDDFFKDISNQISSCKNDEHESNMTCKTKSGDYYRKRT